MNKKDLVGILYCSCAKFRNPKHYISFCPDYPCKFKICEFYGIRNRDRFPTRDKIVEHLLEKQNNLVQNSQNV